MSEPAGFGIIPRYMLTAQPSAVKVYLSLALHVDWDTGVCWPSRATICDEAGVSLSTCKRALKDLEKIGAIQIEARFDDAGDSTSNLYRLPFAVNRRGGVMGDPTQGHQRTDRGVTDDPQTRTRRTRRGLTPRKEHPELCAHLAMDDEGYCTVCGFQKTAKV